MSRLVKICGLRSQADVDAAQGADLCGFIFHPPSPRTMQPDVVARIDTQGMRRVGVFVTDDVAFIIDAARQARLDVIQLHGDQPSAVAGEITSALSVAIIRVLWPDRHEHLKDIEALMHIHARDTQLFLMDSGTSGGGSGKTIRWERLHKLESPRPWLIAGGIGPENALAALHASGAHGVDLNSSLESSPGHKDHARMRAALDILRGNT